MIEHFLYGNCKKKDLKKGDRVSIDIGSFAFQEGIVESVDWHNVYIKTLTDQRQYYPINKVMKIMRLPEHL